jgi:hypothetical protein
MTEQEKYIRKQNIKVTNHSPHDMTELYTIQVNGSETIGGLCLCRRMEVSVKLNIPI